MKKTVWTFLVLINLIFAENRIKTDVFLSYDLGGKMKVDETEIRERYVNNTPNFKFDFSYRVYKSIYLTTGLNYETYSLENYGKYKLMPLLLGIRYMDEKNSKYHPYITLLYGLNILENPEDLPIDTRKNGFAEIDGGLLYKEKYFFEIAYKHHALAYKKMWPTTSSYWNGEILSFNIGYRLK